MEGLFVSRTGETLDAKRGSTQLSLLSHGPGIEVMRQTISPGAIVWVTPPANDLDSLEFFYVLRGSLVLLPDSEALQLQAGDCFYTSGIKDDVLIKAKEVTELLYVSNRFLFENLLSFQGDLKELMHRVDVKDKYTYQHSMNVMDYSLQLFRKICPGLSYNDITTAALFHDVGKCLLPDEILKKPSRLTTSEYLQVMKHPLYSSRLLEAKFGSRVAEIARCHHERLDGSGYPFGLRDNEISLESRIIAVADSFDAMTSIRVYRNYTKTFIAAAEELCSETRLYDAEVSKVLLELVKTGELTAATEAGV